MNESARRRPPANRRTARLAAAPVLLVFALVLSVGASAGISAGAGPRPGEASSVSSPVDLSTPVDLADGAATRSAIVRAGDARIEVLSPTLLRLEYSPTGTFENAPTVNAVDRRMPVPPYRSGVSAGWLTVRTAEAVLRYKVGSGPFTSRNTSLHLSVDGKGSTVHPTWDWECTYDQICQVGAASLGGGTVALQATGSQSLAGYVATFLKPGARATWQVLGSPAGPSTLRLRYSAFVASDAPPSRSFDLVVNGRTVTTVTAPLTSTIPVTTAWATLTATVSLRPGTNSIGVRCPTGENCDTDFDTLSVAPPGAPAPVLPVTDPLGGWIRGFDTDTYNITPTCGPGEQPSSCQAGLETLHSDGLLDEAGWRLLDDTQSAVWTPSGWVQPRPSRGDVEDGYLFAYGHDYAGALQTLAELTGPAPLLPRDVFGVWYSDYTPYSSRVIENSLYPEFVANNVPLNTLSLDTDWKEPNNWNGWSWNRALFPDAGSFLAWAHRHGIDVTLNIHSGIADNDPKLPAAERIAGGTLSSSNCQTGPCKVWDWSSIPQAESNFSLQQSFQRQGVDFWWFDWCCDASVASMPGVTPDAWIGHLYAQEMVNRGQRGFVLARIGASNGSPEQVYPAGPWSDHTSAIAFTGDAWGTWNTLAQEAALTPAEASIGEPYVSDDIGSFLGPPPTQSGADPPDLYDRWVQLGTFQPILRLHSDDEDRLPWQYPQPVRSATESFLRLREELVPYTYTLAARSHETGIPMDRPLYLDYPDQPDAYTNPTEFLDGPDVLVAPVTTPGALASTSVWFPPGRWVDYFTGATFTGPSTATLVTPLDRMPVFVRAGGILPEQASVSGEPGSSPAMTLRVYPGANGSFRLYDDAGTGLGYTRGQDTETSIRLSTGSGSELSSSSTTKASTTKVTIGPAVGHFPDQATTVNDRVEMVDLSRPSAVSLDGRPITEAPVGSPGPGWSYSATTDTLIVSAGYHSTSRTVTVAETGAHLASRSEPIVAVATSS